MGEELCNHCGEPIDGPKPWRRDYCSRQCANSSKTLTTVESECPNCGDTFEHEKTRSRQFCSRGCSNAFHHDGEKSPHYVDGEGEGRKYGPNWSEQKRRALERDFFQCRCCRITNEECQDVFGCGLHVHHQRPRRFFDNLKRANRIRNLITLCPRCHARIEESHCP